MKCPECNKPTGVKQTTDHGTYVYRRHECFNGHRFSTMEQVHEYKDRANFQAPGDAERQLIRRIKEMLS